MNFEKKYSAVGTRDGISVIDSIESTSGAIRVEVLQYDNLVGGTNLNTAQRLWFSEQKNIKARQVAIHINDGGIKVEPGAMSYFRGNLEMISGVTPGKLIGKMIGGALTGEKTAMPEYTGSGLIVLEPSFQHFILINLGMNEEIITDKGMFFACEKSVTVTPVLNKTVSGALLGGEGIFQTSIKGPGVVVLESQVPMSEIDIIELNNETLKVDGNFALLRTPGLTFSVERSAQTLVGSAMSGEGLVNVYRGTGTVWLAPTLKIYNLLRLSEMLGGEVGAVDTNSSNTRT